MKEQQLKRPRPESKGADTANAALSKIPALPQLPLQPHAKPIANPHYVALGGETALQTLVQRFYILMDTLPLARALRALHPADLTKTSAHLFMFLSGWLGGPQLYAERFGQPRLRHAHATFVVDAAARDAWMDCMTQALHEQVSDAALRTQLIAAFYKTADFLCNQTGA
ncbi:MAG: group II truncated hemoglobin [Burkholderiaceae bacterium]